MSVNGQSVKEQQIQQLQRELKNELTSSNQLLKLISTELHLIKQLTCGGSELEKNVIQNATLIDNLANMQRIDLKKISGAEKGDQ